MELWLEQPENESTDVIPPQPLRQCAKCNCGEPPMPTQQASGSSEEAECRSIESGDLSVRGLPGDDGAGPSMRVRPTQSSLEYSRLERNPSGAVPHTLLPKEVPETPHPHPNCLRVEATSDSSAPVTHAAQSPPQTGPKAFDGMPVDQLVEEFDTVTAQQAALVAQLRARFSNERSQSIQKDEEILLLKAQLVDAQAEAESSRSYAQHLAEEKMALLVKVEQERADAAEYKASCHWEVRQSFGDVVKCALARGKAEAVEELHERRLLTVPAAQVPGYNQKAYEELVAAMEAMKLLELPHIAQLERDQDYPIGVIMTGFLSLEAHAIRLAKKTGVKGKAILCGVGAAHLPRSDGVPVSVATVSPKDSELLGKLEEAGDAAYQVG
ncbi:hypothetical protein Tco_0757474, partial [Tanacetum coccineum]